MENEIRRKGRQKNLEGNFFNTQKNFIILFLLSSIISKFNKRPWINKTSTMNASQLKINKEAKKVKSKKLRISF